MKIAVLDTKGVEKGKIELPNQFLEEVRADIIYRAVLSIMSKRRQPYGTDPKAGKKHNAKLSKQRHAYKGVYGYGISRTPRKIMSRSGSHFSWVGAFAPQTVGGRKAHPPKAKKIWVQKINELERKKAIRSALAATIKKELVESRGHLIPEKFPFVVDSEIENIKKAKELVLVLKKFGFGKELERLNEKKIRAGKGKMRGRKYKKKRGMLIVVSGKCNLLKIKSVPGVEIMKVNELNVEVLAPGTRPGRLTLFTNAALETMKKQGLFLRK